MAWAISVLALFILILFNTAREVPWYYNVSPLVILVFLLYLKDFFTVKSEPRSIKNGILIFFISIILAILYGVIGFWLLEKSDFGYEFNLSGALVRTLRQIFLLGNRDLVPKTRHARWFLESLNAIGLSSFIFGIYSLFRPVAFRLYTLPHERDLAKKILKKNGSSALDFFKVSGDKRFFFNQEKTGFIAYKLALNVAVALGDPVASKKDLENLIDSFVTFCKNNGWIVAFHQTSSKNIPLYEEHGLTSLKIGEEGVVNLKNFEDITSNNKNFKHLKNWFIKRRFKFVRLLPPQNEKIIRELHEVSEEWLNLPGRRERSFSVGKFEKNYIKGSIIDVVEDPEGKIIAFVNEIPTYVKGEATVDLMRHRIKIPNSAMEYLFCELFLALKKEGFEYFNLGLAPMAGIDKVVQKTLSERAVKEFFERMSWFFSYKGLKTFKDKFDPAWKDVYLAYSGGPATLVRVGLAIARITES